MEGWKMRKDSEGWTEEWTDSEGWTEGWKDGRIRKDLEGFGGST